MTTKSPKPAPLRALIVDDSPDMVVMMDVVARRAGYSPVMTTNPAHALYLAQRSHFDLIITDISMPEIDGYTLVKRLRRLPEYVRVPMISVTGIIEFDDSRRSLAHGFDAHLRKPVNLDNLLSTIENAQQTQRQASFWAE